MESNNKLRNKSFSGGGLPKFVNVRDENGDIITMPYRELKAHEEAIIEDNMGYGRKLSWANG